MGIFRNPAVIITLILLIVLLFGAKRLPDVARSVGSSLKIFKKELKDLGDDEDTTQRSTPSGTPAAGQDATASGTTHETSTSRAPQDGSAQDGSPQVSGRTDPHQS